MSLRQAAQHALKVMDDHMYRADTQEFYEAKEALRAALAEPSRAEKMRAAGYTRRPTLRELAEPEQGPVAWRTFDGEGGYDYRSFDDNENYAAEWAKRNPRHVGWVDPLYTAPIPRTALTDEGIDAAELRRLHAENEALKTELAEQARLNGMGSEREARLLALNAELVEALRCADAMLSGANMDAKAVERKVSAALAKVEASK